MKVLFLDIDGVLNTFNNGGLYTISKRPLKQLKRIVEETDCKLVLSSTWRKLPEARFKLDKKLMYKNLSIYDYTISFYYKERQIRGDEIQFYLNEHPEVKKYAIVDDDGDMLESQLPFFVQTDGYKEGLTKEKADQIIKILKD